MDFTKPYSEERAKIMDEEVTKLVELKLNTREQNKLLLKIKDKAVKQLADASLLDK